MKEIYMNDTVLMIQSTLKKEEFETFIMSGYIKTFNDMPYLVIENKEENEI